MINLACFIHSEWAYGSIHHELVKLLYPYGIDSLVLCWEKKYNIQEFNEYDRTVDLYLTAPQGTHWIWNKGWASPNKCLTVFHSQIDLLFFKENFTPELIAQCGKFGAVSEYLITRARELGITVDIEYLPLGINYERYAFEPSSRLEIIGYAGIYHPREEFANGVPVDHPGLHKRSYLVSEIANDLNLKFKMAAGYHTSYVTMPGYYPTVDCVICPSINEGAGLPALEAGAAGKLVLTTPVGHFPEKVTAKGAIPLPFDEKLFKDTAKRIIEYYVKNPNAYRLKCEQIKEHARSYDWKYSIEYWAKFILSQSTK
jgi:hypothetical protein